MPAGSPLESPFLLLLAREGREDFVKSEMATRFLGSKFAFSRPGFLSFKAGDVLGKAGTRPGSKLAWTLDSMKDLVFPLRSALFAGKVSGKKEGEGFQTQVAIEALPPCAHLHFLDYASGAAESEDLPVAEGSLSEWEEAAPGLRAALAPFIERAGNPKSLNAEAAVGDGILQVFRVAEKEFWIGYSRLRESEFGWPGGESHVDRPEAAPSRAYVKIEEAIALLERGTISKPTPRKLFRAGERAVEIGAAPGGACYALLERGLQVLGIDRGTMAPIVVANPKFSQVFSSVGSWEPPDDFAAEWLLIDMNAEPSIALRESKHVLEKLRPKLKGVFITLKLNRPEFAVRTERLAEAIADDLGLGRWYLKHLPSHHQELLLFGTVGS